MARSKTAWHAENERPKRGRPRKTPVDVDGESKPSKQSFSNPLSHLSATKSSGQSTGEQESQRRLSSETSSAQLQLSDEFPGDPPEAPPGYASDDELDTLDQGALTALGKRRPPAPRITKIEGCIEMGMTSAAPNRIRLTQKGLDTLEDMAAEGRSKASIASALGVSVNWLDNALNEMQGDNPTNDAWQRGKGRFADETVGDMRIMAGKGNVIAGIWLSKSEHGKRDDTIVKEGAKHVHIHMPESMTPEQYMQFLQQQHETQHRDALAAVPADSIPKPKPLPQFVDLTKAPEMPDFVKEAVEKARALSSITAEHANPTLPTSPAEKAHVPALPSREAQSGDVER